jgi:hypothetical protein
MSRVSKHLSLKEKKVIIIGEVLWATYSLCGSYLLTLV